MREAIDYEMVIVNKEENDYYLCSKKVNKIDKQYILHDFNRNVVHIDDGYYVVEYTPKKEYYNARVYIDDKKNIIDYYFDITNGNGLQDKIPYYDDLYLDIIYCPNENNCIYYDDMDELEEAFSLGDITKEEYERAIRTGEYLFEEIKNGKNFFVNLDVVSIIEKYF
jgi:predicted RNA-binding protein associated with RNAse of E/G family